MLRLATFIDEWLARSGQLPLYISLCFDHDPSDPWYPLTVEEYRPILKILEQYSSRWHILDISFPPSSLPLDPFLQPDHLPLLEQLYITCASHPHPYHVIFPPAPRLNTVKIQPFPFMNPEIPIWPNVKIQWDTVTHLSAKSITSYSCFLLLRLNPQLVHCTFHDVVHDLEDHDHLESPILSSLTYLSLHHRSNPSRVLNNIKLPCLEMLVLLNVSIDPVIAFLERSACSLHTLSLLNWHLRETDKLIPLLQFLSPSLTKLAISQIPSPIRGAKNYLSILARIYTSQSEVVGNDFLPHLKDFEYRERSWTSKSSMLSNLPSRNPKPTSTSVSLRSVYIDMASIINKDIPHDISLILQRLEKDGILTYT
jgi:hypothetical protein